MGCFYLLRLKCIKGFLGDRREYLHMQVATRRKGIKLLLIRIEEK